LCYNTANENAVKTDLAEFAAKQVGCRDTVLKDKRVTKE
jgi:hypothetical protein